MFSFPRLTPVVKKLLIGLFGFFVLELILTNWVGGVNVFGLLALDPAHPGLATLWQLVTYVLVWPPGPGSVLNILIALLFTWWVLSPFEESFGGRRTMQLSAVAILSASLPALVAGFLFQRPGEALYGCNAILIAAIVAFAYSLRGRGQLSLFGVLPMRPMVLIWVVVGFSVLMFLASMNLVSLVADLGAVGGGILFVKWMTRPRRPKRRAPRGRRGGHEPFSVISGGRKDDDERPRWLN